MPEAPGRPGIPILVPTIRYTLERLAPAIEQLGVAVPPRQQLDQMVHWQRTLDLSPDSQAHLTQEIGQLQRELKNHPELENPNSP
jgi:hypothetical protein